MTDPISPLQLRDLRRLARVIPSRLPEGQRHKLPLALRAGLRRALGEIDRQAAAVWHAAGTAPNNRGAASDGCATCGEPLVTAAVTADNALLTTGDHVVLPHDEPRLGQRHAVIDRIAADGWHVDVRLLDGFVHTYPARALTLDRYQVHRVAADGEPDAFALFDTDTTTYLASYPRFGVQVHGGHPGPQSAHDDARLLNEAWRREQQRQTTDAAGRTSPGPVDTSPGGAR